MGNEMRIAIYMRLSKGDELRKENSNSIQMQRIMLRTYVEAHFDGFRLTEYQDDGYSGTNFNRPGIKCLLEQVKKSEIDCIVIKDFSRFSRDYIELGAYLEQIFPFMGVRLISVNDGYDSSQHKMNAGELDTYFKTLLYDLYSKDLSVKVKSSLKVHKESGEYVSANCPFGYVKDPNDRHMLLIDQDEARVIRRIFELALKGQTSAKIAKRFNEEKVKTPIEWKAEKKSVHRAPKGGSFTWSTSAVCNILSNKIYVGDVVYGKFYREEVGGRNHKKPKEEWNTIHHHHEPIIDMETFNRVQEKRVHNRLHYEKKAHPLVGKLVCGCCCKNLTYRGQNKNPYFDCYNRYVNGKNGCVTKVNAMFLEQFMLYELQQEMIKLLDIGELKREQRRIIMRQLKMLIKQKNILISDIDDLNCKCRHRYEQYTLSREPVSAYQRDGAALNAKKEELKNQLSVLENRLSCMQNALGEGTDLAGLFTFFGLTRISHEIADIFIRKIIIYDEWHMEIQWNFCGNIMCSYKTK